MLFISMETGTMGFESLNLYLGRTAVAVTACCIQAYVFILRACVYRRQQLKSWFRLFFTVKLLWSEC